MVWTFLNYVDEAGVNRIGEWVRGLPASQRIRLRAKLDTRVEDMSALDELAGTPYLTPLAGYHGLFEIKMRVRNVQYRPLACFGPGRRAITILVGAEERDGEFVPRAAPKQALGRMRQVLSDGRYVCPHDLS